MWKEESVAINNSLRECTRQPISALKEQIHFKQNIPEYFGKKEN